MYKKKLVLTITLALILVMTGCRGNKDKILADFNNLIESPASSKDIVVAALFLEEKIDDVDSETAKFMVSTYRNYLHDYIHGKRDKTRLSELGVYLDKDTGLIDDEKSKNSSHYEYYEDIRTAGLMLSMCGEEIELSIDYEVILEKFGDYMPEPMKSFYELEKKITLSPATKNAKLIITWQELLDRALETEQILKDFPDDEIIRQEALWRYKRYLGIILMGTTNSPIFDYTTKEFSESALKAYKEVMADQSDTVLAWTLVQYTEYLRDIDYTMDLNDNVLGKAFFDSCDLLVTEAEKRVNGK